MSAPTGTAATPPKPSRATILDLLLGVSGWTDAARLLPGALLAFAVMLLAQPVAEFAGQALLRAQGLPTGKSPISGVAVAILLGLLIQNSLPLPSVVRAGLQFCITKLLRLGIILVGVKLSLLDVAQMGLWGLPIVITTIATGLLVIHWLNRALGLPPALGVLMAAGTSICGITAIVSTAGVIRAPQREVAYAVANVTLFGLIAMLAYPHLAPLLLATSEQIGLFLGTAIHDTSQVIGAALTYKELRGDSTVLKAATVTKLSRNLFLAVVVPLAAVAYSRERSGDRGVRPPLSRLLPLFILGFVAMSVIRTIGDATLASGKAFGLLTAPAWRTLTETLAETAGARLALGTALAAVGLSTSLRTFREIGAKPLLVGLLGALVVGAAGLLMSRVLGGWVHIGAG